jgi:hypothetical protein
MSDENNRVFLATPTYDGMLHSGCHAGIINASRQHDVQSMVVASSFLTHGFNLLWCHAIASGAKYWAMLHADIGPENYWLETMLEQLEASGADILSAVVPIKSREGVLSTALSEIGCEAHYRLRAADLEQLPVTFDGEDLRRVTGQSGILCVNTGCWVCRLTDPWVKQISFRTHTAIRWDGDVATCEQIPEDWDFSHQCHTLGLKVMATRAIKTTHWGAWSWSSKLLGVKRDATHTDVQAVPTPACA